MNKMLIIKDIRDWFWCTFPNWKQAFSLDVLKLKEYFKVHGFEVEITSYENFDFTRNYKGYYVLYGSFEDYYAGTKDYIEDVILWLQKNGAYIMPRFEYFRAHENKVMMELLRKDFKDERLKSIKTRTYPSLEALGDNETEFPVVIKASRGSGGGNVALANNKEDLYKKAKIFSRLTNEKHSYLLTLMPLVNIKRKLLGIPKGLINNRKFITQTFIPNLSGDYKVLIFGDHYFVLHRLNRDGDFRASGSGKFTDIPENELEGLLEFSRLCKSEIPTPHLSIDVCFDGKSYHLIEFQCLTFGFKAMSMSQYHFVPEGTGWKRIDGRVSPEEEFCQAVTYFLTQQKEESIIL